MKLIRLAGATSEIWQIFIADSSSTTGAGLTNLAFNTAGLTAYYHRDTDTTATAITLATMTVGTFTSSGFKEIDATNMPGWYQFCPPNAAIASGAKSCAFHLKGATNMAPLPIEVQLVSYNPDDAVRLGLTGLANATPGAAGGLFIAGTNAPVTITGSGDALTISSSGANGVALKLAGNGSGAGLQATGGATGAGAKFIGGGTSGDGIDVTTTSGDGLAITPTAGNAIVATANGTSKHGIVATGGTAGTSDGLKAVAGTGGVPIRGDITGNVTGNLSGSVGSVTGAVGSVTGAVGSVTGNVGGNVSGSVGSVATGGIAAASFAAGAIDATAIAANAIAAAKIASGAITAAKFAAGAIDATALASDAANEIADASWVRDMSAITRPGGGVRYPLQAVDVLRNKVDTSVSPAVVYQQDDVTSSWTTTLTTDATANPVTVSDPT